MEPRKIYNDLSRKWQLVLIFSAVFSQAKGEVSQMKTDILTHKNVILLLYLEIPSSFRIEVYSSFLS